MTDFRCNRKMKKSERIARTVEYLDDRTRLYERGDKVKVLDRFKSEAARDPDVFRYDFMNTAKWINVSEGELDKAMEIYFGKSATQILSEA